MTAAIRGNRARGGGWPGQPRRPGHRRRELCAGWAWRRPSAWLRRARRAELRRARRCASGGRPYRRRSRSLARRGRLGVRPRRRATTHGRELERAFEAAEPDDGSDARRRPGGPARRCARPTRRSARISRPTRSGRPSRPARWPICSSARATRTGAARIRAALADAADAAPLDAPGVGGQARRATSRQRVIATLERWLAQSSGRDRDELRSDSARDRDGCGGGIGAALMGNDGIPIEEVVGQPRGCEPARRGDRHRGRRVRPHPGRDPQGLRRPRRAGRCTRRRWCCRASRWSSAPSTRTPSWSSRIAPDGNLGKARYLIRRQLLALRQEL